MRRRSIVAMGVAAVLLVGVGLTVSGAGETLYSNLFSYVLGIHYHMPKRCELRLAARLANEDRIERESREKLAIGTKREGVINFFAANGMTVSFSKDEAGEIAEGTVQSSGDYECRPVTGCGSDEAIWGVSVELDTEGNVSSEPKFNGIYSNCV